MLRQRWLSEAPPAALDYLCYSWDNDGTKISAETDFEYAYTRALRCSTASSGSAERAARAGLGMMIKGLGLVVLGLMAVLPWLLIVAWCVSGHRRARTSIEITIRRLPEWSIGLALGYPLRVQLAVSQTIWWRLRARHRNGRIEARGGTVGRPVLCIHGFLLDGTCFWGLRQRLAKHGRASYAVSMGRPPRVLRAYAPPLIEAFETLRDAAPDGFDVVAHSMGGLITRIVLSERPDLAPSIRNIVTVASPHHGTPIPAYAQILPELKQMAADGRAIDRLPDLGAVAPSATITTIASPHDLTVYPASTSHLPRCRAVDLPVSATSACSPSGGHKRRSSRCSSVFDIGALTQCQGTNGGAPWLVPRKRCATAVEVECHAVGDLDVCSFGSRHEAGSKRVGRDLRSTESSE